MSQPVTFLPLESWVVMDSHPNPDSFNSSSLYPYAPRACQVPHAIPGAGDTMIGCGPLGVRISVWGQERIHRTTLGVNRIM